MSVEVRLVFGPLSQISARPAQGSGAWLRFEGIVRPMEDGREILALDYEVYDPMTVRELTKLAEAMVAKHELDAIVVEHSRRRVPVHAVSFRLDISSKHRKAALMAADEFIDRMKREVPIWKILIHADSESHGELHARAAACR